MDNDGYKEVYFAEFCPQCIHSDLPEVEEIFDNKGRFIGTKPTICADCLDEPAREYSHTPVKFVRKKEK